MTRLQLSQMNEQALEESRLNKIDNIVSRIYSKAISAAKQGLKSYRYQVPLDSPSNSLSSSNTFHVKYMNEILASLRRLFPDSRIVHTLLGMGRDGRIYDIATMDDRILDLVINAFANSYIVIDWS